MTIIPTPLRATDAYQKPAISASDLLSAEQGNIFQKLANFARDVGQEGALLQDSIEERAPAVAPVTNAFIPQSTLGVAATPLSLGAMATKTPSLVKGLAGGLQGMFNTSGSEAESSPASEVSADILDQIANEGRTDEAATDPRSGMLTAQDILDMMNSGETTEPQKKNAIQEFFDRWLANQQGRNYDMEQLALAQSQDPQAQFKAQLPGLLKTFMEQDARLGREMSLADYKSQLERNKFLEFPGLTESPIF